MGTLQSWRKAYGALKDTTMVGLAKVNSEFKDLDIAIVKATNHVECPPKERHVRKIFAATSAVQPRADVAYCIHALARRLAKTRNWIVALKTLIVFHRTLREGDPTFREELLNYSQRGHVLQISNFKDDSSPLAWDCSAWVRSYALFLEERLECFRILRYDIEAERMSKFSHGGGKGGHSRTRVLGSEELLEQLPALQQLLYRLVGCQPEGAAFGNYLIQYALALVLKESFKIYCAINDGIINLVDVFFDMSRHDAVKALNTYKRAGQQAENLAYFYEFCKGLDLARNFQFPTLRQPPPSFLATMEEYIKEAPRIGSVSQKRLEYHDKEEVEQKEEPQPEKIEEPVEEIEAEEPIEEPEEEPQPEIEVEAPLVESAPDTVDLLGLHEIHPKAAELEQNNAMALAIIPSGDDPLSSTNGLAMIEAGGSGWELALVTAPTNNTRPTTESKLAGGFDKLLLDSLYEDDTARRQLQLQNAGYGIGSVNAQQQNEGYSAGFGAHSQFNPQDPFSMSNSIAPPPNVQMALMSQQQQQQMMMQQQQNQQHMALPYQYNPLYPQQPLQQMEPTNPFGDPFLGPSQSVPPKQGHNSLI